MRALVVVRAGNGYLVQISDKINMSGHVENMVAKDGAELGKVIEGLFEFAESGRGKDQFIPGEKAPWDN